MKASWECQSCGESCASKYDICWNCGSHQDGSPAAPDFVRYDARLPEQAWVSPSNYRIGRFLAGAVATVGWLAIIVGVVSFVLFALKDFRPGTAGESIRLGTSGAVALLFATLCRAVFDIADGRAPER